MKSIDLRIDEIIARIFEDCYFATRLEVTVGCSDRIPVVYLWQSAIVALNGEINLLVIHEKLAAYCDLPIDCPSCIDRSRRLNADHHTDGR